MITPFEVVSLRSRELSLATPEEIKVALVKQGVTDYKWQTIRRSDEEIQTHTNYEIQWINNT